MGSADKFTRWLPCLWTPFEVLNYFGVIYVQLVILVLIGVNGHFTCPILYGSETCTNPVRFGYFAVLQTTLNFICFHICSKRNKLSNLLPGKLRADESTKDHTKFCITCNEAVPNRSHHCSLCKYCVFRKDHHCFMLGGCVGHGNQRFFVGFLFWATVGAVYGTLYAFRYLNTYYEPFWPFGFISYIAPFAIKRWLLWQHCTLLDLGIVLVFSIGFASSISAAGFLLSQFYLILRGKTMYEWTKSKRIIPSVTDGPGVPEEPDNCSFNQRIKRVFGPYWLLNFVVPMPWVKNPLDPHFRRVLHHYYTKDL